MSLYTDAWTVAMDFAAVLPLIGAAIVAAARGRHWRNLALSGKPPRMEEV